MTSYLDEFVRFSRSPELLSPRLFPNAKETLVRAYRSTDICAGKTELRIAWGKKLARVIRRYGWKALERMPTLQLRHAIEERDGVLVQHHKWRELNQAVIRSGNKLSAADRRWTTQRRDHVHIRTCKGKRT